MRGVGDILKMRKAVAYIRSATEPNPEGHECQKAEIVSYAERHNIIIMKTCTDMGFSGLNFDSRPAFMEMLNEVIGGSNDYGIILYAGEGRWGRNLSLNEHYKKVLEGCNVICQSCSKCDGGEENGTF